MPKIADEFLTRPGTVAVFIHPAKDTIQSSGSLARILGQRHAVARMAVGQLGPEGKGKVPGHFLSLQFTVLIGIEMDH